MKRNQSQNHQASKKARTISQLEEVTLSTDNALGNTPIEEHILTFSLLTHQGKSHENLFSSALSLSCLRDYQGHHSDESLQESLDFFCCYLQNDNHDGVIDKTHIASFILPWITKTLLQKQDDASHILWMLFALCVENLLMGSSSMFSNDVEKLDPVLACLWKVTGGENVEKRNDHGVRDAFGSIFSQGTLNKLVPFFIRHAFKEKGGNDSLVIVACRCFGLLVTSNVYRPTMEYVANTLLPMLDASTESMEHVFPNQAAIIFFSVQLFVTVQKKGRAINQKKAFQLICTMNVLKCLAKFNSMGILSYKSNEETSLLLKQVLRVTIFDRVHMEGFWSMNLSVPVFGEEKQLQDCSKKQDDHTSDNHLQKSFQHSYHWALFTSLSNLMEEVDGREAILAFVPKLFKEFVCESSRFGKTWENKRKKRADLIANMQFRVCSNLLNPIIVILKENRFANESERVAILCSTREFIDILLNHDIYMPSFEDPNNVHMDYLMALGEIILASAERHGNRDYIIILRLLFMLNHKIFHEKLSRLIHFVMLSQNIEEISPANEMMSTLCSIYQKLRQLGHFVRSVLMSSSDSDDESMSLYINSRHFCRALTGAIQSSPVGQLEEVWLLIENHTVTMAQGTNIKQLALTIDIFIILLKAVQVGLFNSKTVKALCEQTMSRSVYDLLGVKNNNSAKFDLACQKTTCGLNLWGWIVHVHIKCCFWSNYSDEVNIDDKGGMCGSKLIPSLLDSIKAVVNSDFKDRKALDALQLLATHRLQQLHSVMFQQHQVEACTGIHGSEPESSKSMLEESKFLAAFIIRTAHARLGSWILLCQNLSSWIPYAEEEHIEMFLVWFFSIHSVPYDEEVESLVYVPIIGKQKDRQTFINEYLASKSLLCDASFYELHHLFHHMCRVGVECVTRILFPGSSFSTCLPTAELSLEHLTGATRILNVMKQLVLNCQKCDQPRFVSSKILTLHTAAIERVETCKVRSHEGRTNLLTFISSCRELLSEIVKVVELQDIGTLPTDILENVFESTKNICHSLRTEKNMSVEICSVVSAGEKYIIEYFAFCLKVFSSSKDYLKTAGDLLSKHIVGTNGLPLSLMILVKLLRKPLHLMLRALEMNFDKEMASILKQIVIAMHPLNEFCLKCIIVHDYCHPDEQIHSSACDYRFFVSDFFSVLKLLSVNNLGCEINDVLSQKLGLVHSDIISKLYMSDTCVEGSAIYVFGAVITRDLLPGLRRLDLFVTLQNIVLKQFKVMNGRVHPIIDTTYSMILSEADGDQVAVLSEALWDHAMACDEGEDPVTSLSAALHCFFFMINVVKGQNQRAALAKIAGRILRLSLEMSKPLCTENIEHKEEVADHTQTILRTLLALIGKTDLIALKCQDISSILKSVGRMFDKSPSEFFFNVDSVDSDVYFSSCAIVIYLLKIYPKQLYGCVPSLIVILRRLLDYILQKTTDCNHAMIQEYGKICELLPGHKDVFKKHVMYVILHFVDKTLTDVEPSIKVSLEPSIFLLLDTVSEFEIQQLNTLMCPNEKASFQSLYKNYQKHTYKGQV